MIQGENQWKNLRHWRGILLRGHGWLQNPILSYLSYPLQFRMKKSKDSFLGRCYHLRFCMNFSWRYADEKVNIGQHVWKHQKSPISGIFQLCYQKGYMSSRSPFVFTTPPLRSKFMLSQFVIKTQLLWQTEVVNVRNEHLFEDADLPEQKIGGDDPMFHSKKKHWSPRRPSGKSLPPHLPFRPKRQWDLPCWTRFQE